MRQERTVQATIFEVFAGHEIGCESNTISQRPGRQHRLVSLVAGDLSRRGVRQTGRQGLPANTVLRCALLKQQRQLSYEKVAFHAGAPALQWRDRRCLLRSAHERSSTAVVKTTGAGSSAS